jgi:hypothetical protein
MKKNLLAALAAVFIALGTTARADGVTVLERFQRIKNLYAQAQQGFVSCTSQCDSAQNGCVLGCPALSGTAVPDPRTTCLMACYQADANCRESCEGLPFR